MISDDRSTYTNPVAPEGHDPWVIQHEGTYYYCYSHEDSIWVNQSDDLVEAVQFSGRAVWTPAPGGAYASLLWAPELHMVDGRWYIYVAACDGPNENHRMVALVCDTPDGDFTLVGKLAPQTDRWAIDGTVLPCGERNYFIWSGWEGTDNVAQHLYIAEMASPVELKGERVKISSPEYDWERNRGTPSSDPNEEPFVDDNMPFINEGPQVLVREGRVFVVYSASGSWCDDYCLGLLELVGADPLQTEAWRKHPVQVFGATANVHGPGHACFTKSPDGSEDWIVYHTAARKGGKWNRQTRMQRFDWDCSGLPVFGYPLPTGIPFPTPAGTPQLV